LPARLIFHVDLDPHRREPVAIGESVGGFLQAVARTKPTPPEKSIAFTIGMIALGAKMAKADGVVTEDEIAAFKQVFPRSRSRAFAVSPACSIWQRRTPPASMTYARQMAKLFDARSAILEDVLDGLFHIAKADNAYHPDEHGFLRNVAEIFGFLAAEFARIRARHVAVADDPYLILGVAHDALGRHQAPLPRTGARISPGPAHRCRRAGGDDRDRHGTPAESERGLRQDHEGEGGVIRSPLAHRIVLSPNIEPRRNGRAVDMLVLHYTGMKSADAACELAVQRAVGRVLPLPGRRGR
jgi:DnaJ like chaperone protein